MKEADFSIQQISDITCDIAPVASVPSTIMASTISSPYYGYNRHSGLIIEPFINESVDVMAIDNLPNELPRDASEDFGNMLMSRIIPELKKRKSDIIQRATIAANQKLTAPFLYLSDYVSAS